jgi:hypothetical protein
VRLVWSVGQIVQIAEADTHNPMIAEDTTVLDHDRGPELAREAHADLRAPSELDLLARHNLRILRAERKILVRDGHPQRRTFGTPPS